MLQEKIPHLEIHDIEAAAALANWKSTEEQRTTQDKVYNDLKQQLLRGSMELETMQQELLLLVPIHDMVDDDMSDEKQLSIEDQLTLKRRKFAMQKEKLAVQTRTLEIMKKKTRIGFETIAMHEKSLVIREKIASTEMKTKKALTQMSNHLSLILLASKDIFSLLEQLARRGRNDAAQRWTTATTISNAL
jgi:hypothetical protein